MPSSGIAPDVLLRAGVTAIFLTLLGVALLHAASPAHSAAFVGWLPPCPVKALSGWPCPGCGMGRSLLLWAQLDWRSALAAHPASPLLLIAMAVVLLRPAGWRLRLHPAFGWAALGALLFVWAGRLASGGSL